MLIAEEAHTRDILSVQYFHSLSATNYVKCPCNNFIKHHFNQYFVNNNNNTVMHGRSQGLPGCTCTPSRAEKKFFGAIYRLSCNCIPRRSKKTNL